MKLSERANMKRLQKNGTPRTEYILNEKTPFNITESFRNLKATLSVSVPNREGGVTIMTTSALPEDGKTTVTVNLALMFALSNAKVILIDADIRKGRVAKYFKTPSKPGLSDYLSGQSVLKDVIHHYKKNKNLSYITCGTRSPKPYELLESEEMKKFLDELKKQYDYIIIDTPPVLVISDALALAPSVDGVALVCRHQISYMSDISRALDSLKFVKANILGVIVNDYKEPKQGKIYGGYKSYYDSSYADTSVDEE